MESTFDQNMKRFYLSSLPETASEDGFDGCWESDGESCFGAFGDSDGVFDSEVLVEPGEVLDFL